MWGLAWRNFILQGQRYRVLITALVLGATVFTVLFGVSASLTKTVREKAARYFSGDLVVLTVERKNDFVIENEEALRTAIHGAGVPILYEHRRSLYYGGDAQVFFNGASLIQRRVVGVDFQAEAGAFHSLDLVAGSLPSTQDTERGLWISDDTARRIGVSVGDAVILYMSTLQGFKNTVGLVVTGIFADSSLFGFACYLDYRTLNKTLGRAPGAVTELGVTLPAGWSEVEAARRVQRALEGIVPVAPLSASKEALDAWSATHKSAQKSYGVLTLTGRLKQINDIINGVQAVNLLLTFVFLLVVSIGVYNTYQMIVHERTREVGTMRALGLQKTGVAMLFIAECIILASISSVAGLVLGALALWSLGSLDLSGNVMAEMFLVRGHLVWIWPLQNMTLVLAVMLVTALAGAAIPAAHGARQRPADALRNG